MRNTPIAALAVAGLALAGFGSQSSAKTTNAAAGVAASKAAYLAPFHKISTVGSTVPANGDVNQYGIVIVPASTGALVSGDVLMSNFNAKSNEQGTGTTIVELAPKTGHRTVFAQLSAGALHGSCPGGVGLTTALGILPGGYVVVGSLPTGKGTSATAKVGCLIVLDSSGHAISTVHGKNIEGPWDMTVVSHGSMSSLFVSTALDGGAIAGKHTIDNSTVVRVDVSSGAGQAPKVLSEQVVANKIPRRNDKAALVIGPTGDAFAANGTLYVADTLRSAIIAIPQALTRISPVADHGITISHGGQLNQPLGLALAPNGDLLAANAGNGDIVELSPSGKQLLERGGDAPAGGGSLFGLVAAPGGRGLYYVDDAHNTLRLLH
jgi:sugar lactone lactonase YvrE